MNGQVVESGLEASSRAGGGLAQLPPRLRSQAAGGIRLAGLAERAQCTVEQPPEPVEALAAVRAQRCPSIAGSSLRSQ
jgi:hypothetical protein